MEGTLRSRYMLVTTSSRLMSFHEKLLAEGYFDTRQAVELRKIVQPLVDGCGTEQRARIFLLAYDGFERAHRSGDDPDQVDALRIAALSTLEQLAQSL
jgi:hypothetical protein